ncbi:hypothetical protein EB796_008419 [Bugula neritina]|uniref:Uncharacterized protein n=1 Tax=Bugula neritina TaxID=10212 RepID=A0A7J7K5V1_BUGNE|nr:hypothetical protein EB796_008419 [Bugula neritina]
MGKAAAAAAAAASKVIRWIILSLFMATMLDAALPITWSGIAPSFNISVSTGNSSTSSTTRRGTTPTTPSTTAQTSFPPLPPSPISSASPIGGTQQGISNTYSVLILATILPIAGIVLVIVIIACVVVRQRKRSRRQGRMNHQFQPTGSVSKHGIQDPTFNPHFLRTESVKSDDYYLPVTAEDGLVLHPGASPSHNSRNGPLPRPPVEVPTQHMVGDEYSYAYNKGAIQSTNQITPTLWLMLTDITAASLLSLSLHIL